MGNAHTHVVQRLRERESAHRLLRRDELLAYARCSLVSQQGDGAFTEAAASVFQAKVESNRFHVTYPSDSDADNDSIAYSLTSLLDEDSCQKNSEDATDLPASSSSCPQYSQHAGILLGRRRGRRRECSWREEMENLGVADTGGQLGDFDPGDLGRSEDPTRNRENLYHRSSHAHDIVNNNNEDCNTRGRGESASLLLLAQASADYEFRLRPTADDEGGLADLADEEGNLRETPWTTKSDFTDGELDTADEFENDDQGLFSQSDDSEDSDDEEDDYNSVRDFTEEETAADGPAAGEHNSSSSTKFW